MTKKKGDVGNVFFTKSVARNIFFGGSAFFFLLFLVLTFDTTQRLPKSDNRGILRKQWQTVSISGK